MADRRMTLDQALFRGDGYRQAYEQERERRAAAELRATQLGNTLRALLDAMDAEDVSGGEQTERAYDEARALLDGEAAPTEEDTDA